MLTIDPSSLGALVVQLAKVDASQQVVLDTIDALEAAANADNEPARLVCVQALCAASEEHNEALIDLAEDVRVTLYGPDEG